MHFVVSWDIKAQGPRWTEIDTAMKEGLFGYEFARPFPAFYIVKVSSQEAQNSILKNLTEIGKKFVEAHFIMTPLMVGGLYNGLLPEEEWAKINSLSNGQALSGKL